MALYQLTQGTQIIRTSDGATIPADTRNVDYKAYQAWVALGNTPDAAAAPPAVVPPPPTSAAVLAQALITKGLITQTEINIAATAVGVTFSQLA